MKNIIGLLLTGSLFLNCAAYAQAIEGTEKQEKAIARDQGDDEPKTGKEKKKQKTEQNEMRSANTYSETGGRSDISKPDPYNNDIGGFTVTKFKESKVTKKLRRGEAHSRLSVPNPKGKPLKHKKPHKFLFFG